MMAAEQFVTSFLAGDGGQRFNITKSQTGTLELVSLGQVRRIHAFALRTQ